MQSLVHRVVEPVVGFAYGPDGVLRPVFLNVATDERKRVVGGTAVDDEMLDVRIVLPGNALECALERGFGVERDGCYGEERLHAIQNSYFIIHNSPSDNS